MKKSQRSSAVRRRARREERRKALNILLVRACLCGVTREQALTHWNTNIHAFHQYVVELERKSREL